MHTQEHIEVNGEEIGIELTWEATPCECYTDRGVEKWTEWKCILVEREDTTDEFSPYLEDPHNEWTRVFMEKYLNNEFEPPKE